MQPILYYGTPQGCAFGTIIALEWLCRPYRLSRLELPGQHSPMLQTRSRVMRDCRTILRYIAAQRNHLLGYKPGTIDYMRLEHLLDTLHEEFQSNQARLTTVCAHLNAHLADREWLDGNKRTIADASLVAAVRWAESHAGLDVSRYLHLQRHFSELNRDAAVFFADAIGTGRPAVTSGRFLGHISMGASGLPMVA